MARETASQVKSTFQRINGVGPGIANMAVLLLERAFGVVFDDRRGIDIKPDSHTLRVLYRLGLSKKQSERGVYSIGSNRWSNFYMSYLPQVIRARHISGFVVSARFDDGTDKYIDVSQWFKGPVFEPLRIQSFSRSSLSKREHSLGQMVSI